jgi:hypothetical protein
MSTWFGCMPWSLSYFSATSPAYPACRCHWFGTTKVSLSASISSDNSQTFRFAAQLEEARQWASRLPPNLGLISTRL